MMLRATALQYLELSDAAFEREIALGTIPAGVMLGGKLHWRQSELDAHLDRLTGIRRSWRDGSDLYAA